MKRVLSIISLTLVLVLCLFMFASCGVKSYAKRLEKAGYKVEIATKDEVKEANEAFEEFDGKYKVKAGLTAQKDGDFVSITKFASKKQAKNYVEALKLADGSYEIKGACLIIGTAQGIKDATGK